MINVSEFDLFDDDVTNNNNFIHAQAANQISALLPNEESFKDQTTQEPTTSQISSIASLNLHNNSPNSLSERLRVVLKKLEGIKINSNTKTQNVNDEKSPCSPELENLKYRIGELENENEKLLNEIELLKENLKSSLEENEKLIKELTSQRGITKVTETVIMESSIIPVFPPPRSTKKSSSPGVAFDNIAAIDFNISSYNDTFSDPIRKISPNETGDLQTNESYKATVKVDEFESLFEEKIELTAQKEINTYHKTVPPNLDEKADIHTLQNEDGLNIGSNIKNVDHIEMDVVEGFKNDSPREANSSSIEYFNKESLKQERQSQSKVEPTSQQEDLFGDDENNFPPTQGSELSYHGSSDASFQPVIEDVPYQPIVDDDSYQPIVDNDSYQPIVDDSYQPIIDDEPYHPIAGDGVVLGDNSSSSEQEKKEDTTPKKEEAQKSSPGLLSRLFKRTPSTAKEMNLGEKLGDKFYYNKELKRWVEKGKEHEVQVKETVLPPKSKKSSSTEVKSVEPTPKRNPSQPKSLASSPFVVQTPNQMTPLPVILPNSLQESKSSFSEPDKLQNPEHTEIEKPENKSLMPLVNGNPPIASPLGYQLSFTPSTTPAPTAKKSSRFKNGTRGRRYVDHNGDVIPQ